MINLDVITRMKGQAGERSHIVDVVLSEALRRFVPARKIC